MWKTIRLHLQTQQEIKMLTFIMFYSVIAVLGGYSCNNEPVKSVLPASADNKNIETRKTQTDLKEREFKNKTGWDVKVYDNEGRFVKKIRKDSENTNEKGISIETLEPKQDIITTEPFSSINENLGNLIVREVKKNYKRNCLFAYKIQVQKTYFDQSKKAWLGSGALFFYTIYDEARDGNFETLVFDESDSFHLAPSRRPNWLDTKCH
jgi:hypothetical protein